MLLRKLLALATTPLLTPIVRQTCHPPPHSDVVSKHDRAKKSVFLMFF